jgi:putative permease
MNKPERMDVVLDVRSIFFPLFLILTMLAGLWVLWELREIIAVLVLSMGIAYLLEPVASALESRGLNRTRATAIVFLTTTILFMILVSSIIPPALKQFERIQMAIAEGRLELLIQNLQHTLEDFLPADLLGQFNLRNELFNLASSMTTGMLDFAVSMLSTLSVLVIMPVAIFIFIKDGYAIKKSLVQVIPNRYFEMALNIIHKIDEQLGGYLRGLVTDAAIIGTLAFIGLWIIGVGNALFIGIFAGLANMIPYVGPLAGAVAALLVNFIATGSFANALPIIVVFLIVQAIDNIIVQPAVYSRNVAIDPITIIVAIIIGGKFFGLIGMLFAVPAASILKVSIYELIRGVRRYA